MSPSTARPFVGIEDWMRMETIGALDLKGLEMWVGTYRMMGFGAY